MISYTKFKELKESKSKKEYISIKVINIESKIISLGIGMLILITLISVLGYSVLKNHAIGIVPIAYLVYLEYSCRKKIYFFDDSFFIKEISYNYDKIKQIEFKEKSGKVLVKIFYDSRSLDRLERGQITFFVTEEEKEEIKLIKSKILNN